ncbi:FAEL241Wp [Eremothecium gossypii FDAG1]|nr:FAEL241Wp [Eremothecium gossypii FDAG1]
MLKGFKLKKDSSQATKGRITSADISAPTQDGSNIAFHMNRLRSLSNTSNRGGKNGAVAGAVDVPIILKALYTYHAQSPGELSFNKGELFQVNGEDGEWYEVTSTEGGRKGMVPKSYFEQVSKSRVVSTHSILTSPQQVQMPVKTGSLYAIVLYDFKAEKSDELSAFAGENLFICAHHNFEWFIAKPIGRLGGPGLVPVGFVSIIDINSGYATGNNVKDDIASVNLPTVQEWKNNIAKYKASNISLGSVEQHQQQQQQQKQQQRVSVVPSVQPFQYTQAQSFDNIVPVGAAVESFLLEGEKYWFHVVCDLEDGSSHSLKRYYEDFYDLQVQLLDAYPAEAGKLRDSNGQWTKRIMPYIPGPVPYVTDSITKKRKDDLNIYVKELIALPPHISHSPLVKSLFAIRNNGFDRVLLKDYGNSTVVRSDDPVALTGAKLAQQEESTLTGSDLKERMGELSLNDKTPPIGSPQAAGSQLKSNKIKFYYKDDIFALLLSPTITLVELKTKIAPRIDSETFQLFVKAGDDVGTEITSNEDLSGVIQEKQKIMVLDVQ